MRRLTLFIQDNSFSLTQLGFPDEDSKKGESAGPDFLILPILIFFYHSC